VSLHWVISKYIKKQKNEKMMEWKNGIGDIGKNGERLPLSGMMNQKAKKRSRAETIRRQMP